MLRGLPLTAVAAVHPRSNNPQAVLRALEESYTGSSTVHVVGRRDDNDPVVLTLDIYLSEPTQQLQIQQLSKKPATPPTSTRKCSWVALKQLRAGLQLAIGAGNEAGHSQCEHCTQLATYLERCFERPAIFHRSWNGVMMLSASRVALFICTVLRLVCALPKEEGECNPRIHKEVLALLSSFLAPDLKKTE
ncbi:hypothetical protein Gpo141_00010591 [Globisporangium polare]